MKFPRYTRLVLNMLDLTDLVPRKLTGVLLDTALNSYILLGTITVYTTTLHPLQDEEMPFCVFSFSHHFLHVVPKFILQDFIYLPVANIIFSLWRGHFTIVPVLVPLFQWFSVFSST